MDLDGRAIWPFNRSNQPEYEVIPQGASPTFPAKGIWMCKEELIGNKVHGILHHRFIVFNGEARGFEKKTRLLWGGEGQVRDESRLPRHHCVMCYELKCLKEDCARKIFDKAIAEGQTKTYWLGIRDCQSWANNIERSFYHECQDCGCSDEDKKRRSHWKFTGWSLITLNNRPEPKPSYEWEPTEMMKDY